MNKNYKPKQSIVVRATPEMANWMHPQNAERKKQIQKQVLAAKARFEQRKKHEDFNLHNLKPHSN